MTVNKIYAVTNNVSRLSVISNSVKKKIYCFSVTSTVRDKTSTE